MLANIFDQLSKNSDGLHESFDAFFDRQGQNLPLADRESIVYLTETSIQLYFLAIVNGANQSNAQMLHLKQIRELKQLHGFDTQLMEELGKAVSNQRNILAKVNHGTNNSELH